MFTVPSLGTVNIAFVRSEEHSIGKIDCKHGPKAGACTGNWPLLHVL